MRHTIRTHLLTRDQRLLPVKTQEGRLAIQNEKERQTTLSQLDLPQQ